MHSLTDEYVFTTNEIRAAAAECAEAPEPDPALLRAWMDGDA